jgi:hypothetical protein
MDQLHLLFEQTEDENVRFVVVLNIRLVNLDHVEEQVFELHSILMRFPLIKKIN